jgi:hypothetical protein
MRFDLLIGWRQRVQVTPEPVEPSVGCPARQLAADIWGVDIAREQYTRVEHRLIVHDFD